MLSRIPEQLRSGRHNIWKFLSDVDGNPAKLAIIGPPGSGKTTLLKHLALALAHPNAKYPKSVPVLIFLREHAKAISDEPNIKIASIVSKDMTTKRELAIPPRWFDAIMKHGRALVMLDGLDEVADRKQRNDVADWVDRQINIHATNRFIITSRRHGYMANPLAGVTVLDIRPFTQKQVETFLHRWYLANEIKDQGRKDDGVRRDAKHGAEDLLELLRINPALGDLAVSPLLLTMIATVHKYRNALPGSRAELYEEICAVTFEKRQTEKKLAVTLTAWQKRRVLEPLAWHMMKQKLSAIVEGEAESVIQNALRHIAVDMETGVFLPYVAGDTGIILEREQNVYQFVHLTFQEYLAACHVERNPQHKYDLSTQVGNSWWRECIRLYCALGDATEIIMACMLAMVPDALALGIECRAEAKELDPALGEEFDNLLTGLAEDATGQRAAIANAILKVRLGRMRKVDESRYVDNELIWCAEYQLFIDDMHKVETYVQPAHWSTLMFAPEDAVRPVSGIRFGHALQFCEWLTEREGGQWRFSLTTDDEHDKQPLLRKELMPWRVKNDGPREPSLGCIKELQAMYAYVIENTLTVLRDVIVGPREERLREEHVVDDVSSLAREIAKQSRGDRGDQEVFWKRFLGGAFATRHGAREIVARGNVELLGVIKSNDHMNVSRKLDLATFSAGLAWYRDATAEIDIHRVEEFASVVGGLHDIFAGIANNLGVPTTKRVMVAVDALLVGARGAAEAASMVSQGLGALGRFLSRDRATEVVRGLLEIAEKSRELQAKVRNGELSEVSRDAHRLETQLMRWQEVLSNLCHEYKREAHSYVAHSFVADTIGDLKVARANARFLADYKVDELGEFYQIVQRLGLVDPQSYVGVEQFVVNLGAICSELANDNKMWASLQMTTNPSRMSKFLYYCAICHCLIITALWPNSFCAALELAVMTGVRHEKIMGRIRPFETLRLAKCAY